ncbi:MAG: hypothetical protein JWS10_958 [Cypionkella sp.]|uniref:hypothetical protein n=1 Tax=Cypionkella sp. TaxID=2811411 RepID=UPI0026321C6D|nr:hypothetical protein [Cypionkella sp.]MDB5658343.1 hypothetical protein [Cypionkella sp.]
MKVQKPTSLEVARAAWGAELPDWVETLAIVCGRTTQGRVAMQLDRSGACISQVLNMTYKADTARLEERVRGVFMDRVMDCPGLGEIGAQTCQDWRDKAPHFVMGNPLRQRMRRACNACPRYLAEVEKT